MDPLVGGLVPPPPYATQLFFYVQSIGVPLAIVFGGDGVLPADFWAFPVRTVHYVFSRLLMALIALHVAGALYHTLIQKDGLLRRMFFGRRVVATTDSTTLTVNQSLSRRQS